MRDSSLVRRLLRLAGVVVLAAGGMLATATPAFADPPEMIPSNGCGTWTLTWDSGDVIGGEGFPTEVVRNGAVIDAFEMRASGSHRYGASDGDLITVRRAGLPDARYIYVQPEGCDAPALHVTALHRCDGLELSFTNGGDTAITGLKIVFPPVPAEQTLEPIPAGTSQRLFDVPDGGYYMLYEGVLVPLDVSVWLSGTFERPRDCGSSPTASPTTAPSPGTSGTATPSATASSGPSLPVTGVSITPFVIAGAALIAVGAVLFLLTRRRRAESEPPVDQIESPATES